MLQLRFISTRNNLNVNFCCLGKMQAPSEVLSAGGRTSVSSTSQFRDRYAISKIYHIDFFPLGLISTSSLHSILHGVFFPPLQLSLLSCFFSRALQP